MYKQIFIYKALILQKKNKKTVNVTPILFCVLLKKETT